jgi:dCMP deaminase
MDEARTDRLAWDEYFMQLTICTMTRSADPRTRVGACLVDSEHHILSTGYNGAPKGMPDEIFPWNSKGEETNDILNIKNTFVCHAEANSIDNYSGDKTRLKGATLYVTFFPCTECTKRIIQNGISRVVYLVSSPFEEMKQASLNMFSYAKVSIEKYEGNLEKLENAFKKAIIEIEQKQENMK